MSIRPKVKRRLVILVGATLLLGATLAGLIVLRQVSRNRELAAQLRDGIAALRAGDNAKALDLLVRYVARRPKDADALFYAAQARRKVPTPDGRQYLMITKDYLRRFVELRPERVDILRELVDIYGQLDYHSEVLDAVQGLLAEQPRDPVLLRAKARALFGLRRTAEAIPVAEQCNQIKSDDIETQFLTLRLYREQKRIGDLLARAEAYYADTAGLARGEVLLSLAYDLLPEFTPEQRAHAWELASKADPAGELLRRHDQEQKAENYTPPAAAVLFARKAAQRELDDVVTAKLLVGVLERYGLVAESTGLLEKIEPAFNEPMLRQLLVRRLWEANRFSDLAPLIDKLDVKPILLPEVELIALKAITYTRLQRREDGLKCVRELEANPAHKFAAAWAAVLRQVYFSDSPDYLPVLKATRSGLEVSRSTYMKFHQAEAYAAVGERDLAMEAYRETIRGNKLWYLPRMRLSRLHVEAGHRKEAMQEAELARMLMPSITVTANYAAIWASTLDENALVSDKKLIQLVADVQRVMPGEEQTFALHILFLVRAGEIPVARQALAAMLASKQSLPQADLLRLIGISRAAQLGMEDACYKVLERKYGSTPELALARAIELHNLGKTADGAKLLEQSRPQSDTSTAWRLAWARYMEYTSDKRAPDTWAELADDPACRTQLIVQQAVLAARSIQSNRALLGRVIERIRALMPDQATAWRKARVRMLIESATDSSGYTEAIKLGQECVSVAPNDPEGRLLLAAAMGRAGDHQGAAEHTAAAARLMPDAMGITLDLARLYQEQSDFQRAREVIEGLRFDRLDVAQKTEAARLLALQGETARALNLVEAIPASTAISSTRLLQAELYRHRNLIDKAEPLYADLLKSPTLPVILSAADFYASLGRKDEAEKTLQTLERLPLRPGEKDAAWGEWHSRFGAQEKALDRFRAATQANPAVAGYWNSFIIQCIRQNKVPDALRAAEIAGKSVQANRTFQVLLRNRALIASAGEQKVLLPMIAALIQHPDDAAVTIECLAVLDDAIRTKASSDSIIGKLRPLANRAPRLVPLQTLLVQHYRATGRMDDAAAVAARSLRAVPMSGELAQLAAETLAAAGDWAQALAAARQWRELSLRQPLPADLFTATILLRQNDPQSARQQLQPYLKAARDNPDEYIPILWVYALTYTRANAPDQAAALIWPLVGRSARWRQVWLDLAYSMAGEAAAVAWIERISPVIPPEAVDERVTLANVWYQLGVRTREKKYQDKGSQLLTELAERADQKSASVFFARAIMDSHAGRFPEAEAAYRRALELEPDQPLAMNNLAVLLVDRGGNLAEAIKLADRAVSARPDMATFHDTLGYVQAKNKDYRNAIASLRRAVELEPNNYQWQVNLAKICLDSGDRQQASKIVDEIDAKLPDKSRLPEGLRAKLDELRSKLTASATHGNT